jgi:gamma-glutamyltranspeptidase/glutathione hydrolase
LESVAPALLPGDGAATYAPGGRLLRGGELLHHPGLDTAMATLAERGPTAFYTGPIGALTVQAVRDAGGCLGPDDLAAYRVAHVPVAEARMARHLVCGRTDLSGTVATIAALPDRLTTMPRPQRTVALARALIADSFGKLGDTSNISVVDEDGNACVITLTLGIGSGVWVPGHGFNLNSMLGELELITATLGPGQRIASNMVPLVVVDPHGKLALAVGAAGASRIRSALIGTLVGILVDGRATADAIAAPRLHPVRIPGAPPVAHVEPDYPHLDALADAGFVVNPWHHQSHYFGGVSAVSPTDAAGDPRRGGLGRLLPARP